MIISDLNHLEVASEASSIGGGFTLIDIDVRNNKQSNKSFIKQRAKAESASLGHGKSVAVAPNVAVVGQSNRN